MSFESPREARSLGIATVYQDLAMAPLMSVWRNFFLGLEPTRLLGLYNSYMKRKEENGNGFKISEEFMTKVKSMIV